MDGPFIVHLGGDGDKQASSRGEERLRLRGRYLGHLVETAGVDEVTAERVMVALFDHAYLEGRECVCGCHPTLHTLHDDGFDCPCSWDDTRRAAAWECWTDFWNSPTAISLRTHYETEEQLISDWIAGQTGVQATRITQFAPEQCEGMVDGHSFYFRERHGHWRIEVDLEDRGLVANRFVEVDANGELVTEPVPIMQGDVIAEGLDSQLGDTPADRLAFVVYRIRDHLWARECDHSGALFYCPKCGQRMSELT